MHLIHPRYFVLSLLFLCALGAHSFAQDYKTVHDGVEYAQVEYKLGIDPVKINLLRLDLKKVRLDVHHAMDAAIGTEKTSSIATRHGAVAAINGGFFRLDKSPFAGEASGVLRVDGKLLSESVNSRIALGIINGTKRTEVVFDHVDAFAAIGYFRNGTRKFDGVNRELRHNEIVLYTPEFKTTPRTATRQTEMIFRNCKFGWRKADVIEGNGETKIPEDGYVAVIGTSADSAFFVEHFRKQAGHDLKDHTSIFNYLTTTKIAIPKRLNKAEDVVAGLPRLIKNGKIDITWEQEKSSKAFVETRHPRTAAAKLKDGKFLMITVDGRQPGVSVGMNLNELAEYLLSLGAIDAMNLDGGGSTTMFLDGNVVNQPSDKEGERKVGDAILVTLRKKQSRRK